MLISLFRVTFWFDTVCNIVTPLMNFRDIHLHEHELQLSDYNIYKYSDPNDMYFWYYLQLFILTLKSSYAKIVNIYFSTRNLYLLGKNTSKYCSKIIVVHVHATKLSWTKLRKDVACCSHYCHRIVYNYEKFNQVLKFNQSGT